MASMMLVIGLMVLISQVSLLQIGWGDKAKDDAFIKAVSPISYVTKNSPPIFIVHGNADPTVSYQQSVSLHKKLLELGVKTEFITIEGGVHGKFSKEQNDDINKRILQFLEEINVSMSTKKIEIN
jgi:dipeptidyl aminopeptidase/acylaminoacyl peptidase